jgi:3-methyladenine DNA glycosylase AlkD
MYMPKVAIAEQFVERLKALQSDAEKEKIQRYFKTGEGEYGEGDEFMGVHMGDVFRLAKEFIDMPPEEIERLLESPIHEVRAGALSIMDKQARSKKTGEDRRKELYDLYLRRIDRINNWDLVDLAAQFVVAGYLYDKPRDPLYELAQSDILWERRTAIYGSLFFIRKGELDDPIRIAEMLLEDQEDLIHKPVGGVLREAGKQDRQRLLDFLDQYAATMPRTALRYAIEHLPDEQRKHYMGLARSG